MYTSNNGHDKVVKTLLKEGNADYVNKADNDGWTALMFASSQGRDEVIDILVKEGKADLKKVNNDGLTALEIAFKNDRIKVVSKLALFYDNL